MDLFQGENATLYLSFVNGSSQPINVGVSGLTVDIYHFNNSSLVVDLSSGTMTQQAAPYQNVWYYNYSVPPTADLTTYNVIYNGMFSGASIQSTEVFNVFAPASGTASIAFSGSVAVSGTVVNPSGIGIANVGVTATSGLTLYGSTVTNASGNYQLQLNPASYFFNFNNSNYFTNQTTITIPSGATSFNAGLTTMVPIASGSLVISDTLITMDYYGNPIPLNNLKVTLWSKDTIGGGQSLATTFTNVSGTFFLNANPGYYILQMVGQDPNFNRYNQTRDIEVNSAYAPNYFQYGDTSSYNFL